MYEENKMKTDIGIVDINNTLLTDFYELTMASGYFECDKKDEIAYFDMFFHYEIGRASCRERV